MDVRNITNSMNMNPTGLHTAKGLNYTPTEYKAQTDNSWLQLNKLAQWASGYVKENDEDISERLRMQYGPDFARLYKEGKVGANLSPATQKGIRNRAGWEYMNHTRDQFIERISKGDFNNIRDMQDALHESTKNGIKTVADSYGFKEDDTDFLDGMAKGWDKMGFELVDLMMKQESTKSEATISTQVRQQYMDVFKSSELMYNGLASKEISKNLQNMIDAGEINAPLAKTIIQNALQDATASAGGVNFLVGMKDTKVRMEGFSGTYEELIGPTQWKLLMAQAKSTQADNDAIFNENITLQLTGLSYKSTQEANEILKDAKNKVNYRYRDESTNPFRDQIINAEASLQNRILQEEAKAYKDINDKQKLSSNQALIAQRYQMAINGEAVSLDYNYIDNMKKEDWVAGVNAMVEAINKSEDLTPEDKALRLSELLRVDQKDGPVTAILQTTVDRAATEFSAAVSMGALPDDPKYFSGFQKVKALYDANPSLIAMKYPDIASKIHIMKTTASLGIPKEQVVTYLSGQANLSKEQQFEATKAWTTAKTKDSHQGLSWLPKTIDDGARLVYEVNMQMSGDTTVSLRAASEFVKQSTWKYGSDFKTGSYEQDVYGAIPKNWLQTDNSLDSYKNGTQILSDQIEQLRQLAPSSRITMLYNPAGDYVTITSSTGLSRRISKEELTAIYDADYRGISSLDVEAQRAKEINTKASQVANNPMMTLLGETAKGIANSFK